MWIGSSIPVSLIISIITNSGEMELRSRGIKTLPQSLPEALDALQADTLFHEMLGAEFVAEFIRLKRMEWVDYHRHVSDWEVKRYLEFY